MAVHQAIKKARIPHGTNEVDNDWLQDAAAVERRPPLLDAHTESANEDVPSIDGDALDEDDIRFMNGCSQDEFIKPLQVHPDPDLPHATGDDHHPDGDDTVLLALTADPLAEVISTVVDTMDVGRTELRLSDEAGLERVLDDIVWQTTVGNIRALLSKSLIKLAVMMHFGSTFNVHHRGGDSSGRSDLGFEAKKSARIETCLAQRLAQLVHLLTAFTVPWCIIMPQYLHRDPISLLELPDFDELKARIFRENVVIDGRGYEVLSSVMLDARQGSWNVRQHLVDMRASVEQHTSAGIWGVVDDTTAKATRRAAVLKDKLLSIKAKAQPTLDEADGLKNPITTPSSLKPQPSNIRHDENRRAIGGMRNPLQSLDRVPGHVEVGRRISTILDELLEERPHIITTVVKSIGVEKDQAPALKDYDISEAQKRMAKYLQADLHDNPGLAEVCAPLLKGWQEAAHDPDSHLISWLYSGAPAGIDAHPVSVGIFPPSEVPPSLDFDLTFAEGYNDYNYISMDESPYSREVLGDLVKNGYVTKCANIGEAMRLLQGRRPVVSKGALISKMKDGVMKHRLILDCRVSGANSATHKWERILLPRAWDLVKDAMRLKKAAVEQGAGTHLTYFVCDVADAFYKVPLAAEEQQYFTLCYQGEYYIWRRVGQGSLNGPTLFGRLAAMIGRISQSVLDPNIASIQIYVDDPIVTIRGTPEEVTHIVAKLVLLWRALGFDLATHKAQLGPRVNWIGYEVSDDILATTLSIKKTFMEELLVDTLALSSKNVVGKRSLRSFTGRCNHVANLLFAWRPFMDTLWAAVTQGEQDQKRSWAPKGMIWTRQIRQSLRWISTFLQESQQKLSRTWSFQEFEADGSIITITLDASPWGLGGVLQINGEIVAYFSSPLSRHDERIHRRRIGSAKGQQTWECLAFLVALKIWQDFWADRRVSVVVRSDNLGALFMGAQMRSKASPIISREVALVYTETSFEPRVFEHLPGIANGIADTLSRLDEPGAHKTLPAELREITPTIAPERVKSWYKVLATS